MSPSLQRQEEKKKKKTKSVDNQKLPKVAIVTSPSNMASSLQKEKKNVKIVTPGLSKSKSEVANKEVKQFEPHIAQEPETKMTEHEVKKLESKENNVNAIHLPDVKQVVQSVNADTIDNTTHHMESQNNNNNNNNSSSNNVTALGRKSLLSTSVLRPFSASSRGSSAGSKALKNITTNCLKMINYAAIRQGQAKNKNNSSKRQNSIMMNEFLSAHNKGVAMFETEWRNGYERLYEWFKVESYTPHVMQIQKLMRELDFVKEDCTQKLKFAQQSVCNVLHGVQNMISEVRKTGLLVAESTQCLSVNAPFNCDIHLPERKTKCLHNINKEEKEEEEQEELIESQANVHNLQRDDIIENNSISNTALHKTKFTEKQHDADMWLRLLELNTSVMNEVRDCNDVSTETHPRIKYVSEEEINTINRVSRFFCNFVKDDQLYKLTDNEVVALLSLPDTFIAEEGIEHIVHTQRRKRDKEMLRQEHQIKELQNHLQLMAECVVMLLKRLHMHNSQYVHKMSFQQTILNKVATRVKLADNVLDNVKTINANATAFVLDDLRKLSLNLRSRMDHVEQTILSSLGQLIEASSTGILSNLEECSSSSSNNNNTENVSSVAQDASERKENIMRFFCMAMTEMKQEQCDIMRDIYEFMTFLWRTQQHCEENLTSEALSQEQSEEEKLEMNAIGKEKETMENEKSKQQNNYVTNPVCLGRLEKETLRHRSLPTYYTDVLEQWCDRDMLLRLLHHITLHDHNAMSILLSALDEYVHFLSLPMHHAEAEAILERQREFHEVHRLLIKLHEEGMIDDRSARKHTCSPSYSLADKIKDMIEEYNNNKEPCISKNGNSFASHKLFKEIRNSVSCQEDNKEHYLPFFAFTHPPPAEVRAQMETKSINVKCPFNSAFYTHSAQLHDDTSANKDKHNDSCHTKQYDKCRCDKVEQLPNRGAVMTYLQQSCASDQFDSRKICCGHASNKAHSSNKSSDIDSTKFYTSVVGDGRWGGMAAIKNDNNMHNSLLRRHHEEKNETSSGRQQQSLRHLRYGRDLTEALQAESTEHININASVISNNKCEYDVNSDIAENNTRLLKSTNPIVPAVPTRVNLVNRVIKHCSTNVNVSKSDKNNSYNQWDETNTNKQSSIELPYRSCTADPNRCCSEADL